MLNLCLSLCLGFPPPKTCTHVKCATHLIFPNWITRIAADEVYKIGKFTCIPFHPVTDA